MTFKTLLRVVKVEFLRVPGTREPDTLWVGYRGRFSEPKLRSRLSLQRCSFWPESDSGYVLLRHQWEGDSSFRVTSGSQLKIKLLRGSRKIAKLTIGVDDLLAMKSRGQDKLQFTIQHPLGHALLQLE